MLFLAYEIFINSSFIWILQSKCLISKIEFNWVEDSKIYDLMKKVSLHIIKKN